MTKSRAKILKPIGQWPRMLTQEQAATYVGVTAKTFSKDVKAGTFPGPGLHNKYDRVALDRFLDELSGLSDIDSAADRYFEKKGR